MIRMMQMFHLLALLLSTLSFIRKCTCILDCSAFIPNSSNTSVAGTSWATRLSACFQGNPYDTSQLPILSSDLPFLSLAYDYSVVYVISFDQSAISLLGQLTLGWVDPYRQWNLSQVPIPSIHLPLSEIWYPQVLFLSTIEKRSLKLLQPDDMAIVFNNFTAIIARNVLEGHCAEDYR